MAEKNVKKDVVPTETAERVQTKKEDKTKVTENKAVAGSKYTIDELVSAEKELGANRIIIRTALKKEKKDLFTLEEAKKIVKEFKERKVK